MNKQEFIKLLSDGVWKKNPGVVQLLGLCPTLAMSNSVVNALGLGLATVFVMAGSNCAVSAVRNVVPSEIRIPVFIFIIAALVTIVDLLFNAFAHPLYLVLGIFIPLIVTNCIVLARADVFAAKNRIIPATLDGAFMGLGTTTVLTTLGALRELVGKGTLLSGIDLVFGPSSKAWVLHVLPDYRGFLLAILPPGAFLGLGLLIALRNWLDSRAQQRARRLAHAQVTSAQLA
ncbi:MAG: electron transport complex subunit E [Thiobacillaceae bacterium]